MSAQQKKLLAGNWKMNGNIAALSEIETLREGAPSHAVNCDFLICPPATLIYQMAQITADTKIGVGGQDCHTAQSGAHTGDLSAAMLKDAGASHVILGHSERRTDHGETDGCVLEKSKSALSEDLIPIICLGETLTERNTGLADSVVEKQLAGSVPELTDGKNLIIAYEPVWAIGTGVVPSADDIANMHAHIRNWLKGKFGDKGNSIAILYGGSLKPGNAEEILAIENVDGGLIGGASLKANDLLGIAQAAPKLA